MKKQILSALTAAIILTGLTACSSNAPENGSGDQSISKTDSSMPPSSESTAFSNESIDKSQSNTGSNQSTAPAEFTEEDRKLQAILKDLQGGVNLIINWCETGPFMSSDGNLLTSEAKFKFPQSDKPDSIYVYYLIPDNYSGEGDITMPTTRADMMKLMLEYFTESHIQQRYNIDTGTMTENSDGTFSVVFDEKQDTYGGDFIEVNGRLYRYSSEGPRSHLVAETARVTSKTENVIEFDYTEYDYGVEKPEFERRRKGVLKYERGGWKLDQINVV